jgi:type VI secretion system secreted protein VgrG
MPSPKSGTAGSVVTPTDPDAVVEADDAVAGTVETTSDTPGTKATTTLTSTTVKSDKPETPAKSDPAKTSWISIEMVDEDGKPVTSERYKITLSDGSVAEGTLDDKGCARLDGIDPGSCQVSFPDLDGGAWEAAT